MWKWSTMNCSIFNLTSVLNVLFGLLINTSAMKYANISGDLILGGLFPIHSVRSDGKCGKIQEQDGIQTLEAMVMTLKEVNDKILPGFTLGFLGMDTCETDTIALENSLEFVKLNLDQTVPLSMEHYSSAYVCNDSSHPVFNLSVVALPKHDRIVGVVGAAVSQVSVAVASFLRLFKVPQISYWSTSPELSDADKFKFFKRTVPSDTFQAQAIMEILRYMSWEYVSVLYEQTNYGNNLYFEMERLAQEYGVCFGYVEAIAPGTTDLRGIVEEMSHKLNLNKKIVAVVITHMTLATEIFTVAGQIIGTKRIHWVGVDAWSGRQFTPGLSEIIDGAINVQPLARDLGGFDKYFTSLSPEDNKHDPWFAEYWESHFNCTLTSKSCQDKQLGPENGYRQLQTLYNVKDAVVAFAKALKEIHDQNCHNTHGICTEMSKNLTGENILYHLTNIVFEDSLGHPFSFINITDAPPRYSVMLYHKTDWVEIGNFTERSPGLYSLQMQRPVKYLPSVCSIECATGQERLSQDACCWQCRDCTRDQYVTEDTFQCDFCKEGQMPGKFRNVCIPLLEEYLSQSDPGAIAAFSLSTMGLILCVFVGAVYFKHRKTPLIKASGLELSFVLLVGIFLSYGTSFVIVTKPSPVTCGITRFLLGTCHTLSYAAIFTKTNRIYRIFSMQKGNATTKMKRFTSSQSSLVITFFITFVEVVIISVWLIFAPPFVVKRNVDGNRLILLCSDGTDYSYLCVFVYPLIIMVGCVYLAIKTRKTPDGFKETKFIAFCSYSTLIIWLAFLPLYFSTNNIRIRVVSLCFSLSVNATVILVLLFLSKVHIVLFKPQKNTKERVMSRASMSHVVSNDNGFDHDGMSNLSRMSKCASTFTIDQNGQHDDQRSKTTKLRLATKRDLERMSSGGFSVSSPAVLSLHMSLSASQILKEASQRQEANSVKNNSKEVTTVEMNNAGNDKIDAYEDSTLKLNPLPEIQLNDIKLT